METTTDKEKYIMEEIDLYIRTLREIHFNHLQIQMDARQGSKMDLIKWYEEYVRERSQWTFDYGVESKFLKSGCRWLSGFFCIVISEKVASEIANALKIIRSRTS